MNMKIPPSFSIFPVSGKKPLVSWADFQDRFPTQEEKLSWEKMNKTGYGIVTGAISKILVLDDDGGLDVKKYPIPKTWTAKTPRGGTHYYFKWNSDLNGKVTTKTGVLDKVDTRGDGGFVVHYGFQTPYFTTPLANPPQWLIDLLPSRYENKPLAEPQTEKSKLQETLDGISNGNRNDSFTRIAGSLRARGYSAVDMFNLLVSKAKEVGFSEFELKTICDSVSRYEPKNKVEEEASSIDNFLKDIETVDWIVPGLIAKKSIGFVAGLPETGKTWAMIDLAIQCAKGDGLWLNKFPVTKQKVLFIDQERFKGETQRRFKSVLNAETGKRPTGNLFIKSGTTIRLNLQNSFDAFRKELSELRPDLVIIDSFATIHTLEENNRQSIQSVLEKVKELRNEFGCTFLFVHHESKTAYSKDSGDPSVSQMAGSVAIPAVAETVFTVRKQDAESSMIYHTKSTLSSTIAPFLMKVVDISKDKIKVEAY